MNRWTIGRQKIHHRHLEVMDNEDMDVKVPFFFHGTWWNTCRPIKTIDDGNRYLYLGINSSYWYFHGNREENNLDDF